ncbi:zonadhesin-like [Pelodytes ibericus]
MVDSSLSQLTCFSETANLCPPGAQWSTCTGCSAYCREKDTVCATVCQEGCKCEKAGYVIHENACIPASECPAALTNALSCPPRAKPSDCAGCWSHCPILNGVCPAVCQRGCECKEDGYVLHENACIPASECPIIPKPGSPCPVLTHWVKCSHCSDYCPVLARKCDNICRTGCVCNKKGHVLNEGKCIPVAECPLSTLYVQSCPMNAVWSFCTNCDSYCFPERNCNTCRRGCVCKEKNYALHEGKCIPLGDCPNLPISVDNHEE